MRIVFIAYLILSLSLNGQITSPFNGLELDTRDSNGTYSFIVSGHFYGGNNNSTGYPVNTILGNLENINQRKSAFLICLGDLFMDVGNDIPYYEKSLFQPLKIPLLNSVGNHDLTGNIYQENFGETTNKFRIGRDIHIIIDTERNNGDLKEDQISILNEALELVNNGQIENVFIYGHRTLWTETYPEMEGLFEDNTQSILTNNFATEVLPILEKMGENARIFWFGGSLGNSPSSFFYHYDEARNITYIATAIRGLPRDAILHVTRKENGVNFEVESLTGQSLKSLEEYNVDFWQENINKTEPFNWRLVPLYIQNTFLSRYFYYGLGFAFILIVLLKLIKGKLKK